MSAKHTPGPWRVGYWGGICRDPIHVAARRHPGEPECVYVPEFQEGYGGIAGAQPNQMVVSTNDDELVISDADAHLIAAAPELLEALKSAQEVLCGRFCPRVDGELVAGHSAGCRKASEVIRKAEEGA